MTVKVEFDKEGTPVGVDGAQAVTVNVETGHSPGKLHVRFTAVPIGDDALYAGGLEGHFTLTVPERVPSMDSDEQARVGSEYAHHMIAAMSRVVGEDLNDALIDAAKDATTHGEHKPEKTAERILAVIATSLLLLAKGDPAVAKLDAMRLAYGEKVHGIEPPFTLNAEDRHELIVSLNAAIDRLS
jgi:hypothetical protein